MRGGQYGRLGDLRKISRNIDISIRDINNSLGRQRNTDRRKGRVRDYSKEETRAVDYFNNIVKKQKDTLYKIREEAKKYEGNDALMKAYLGSSNYDSRMREYNNHVAKLQRKVESTQAQLQVLHKKYAQKKISSQNYANWICQPRKNHNNAEKGLQNYKRDWAKNQRLIKSMMNDAMNAVDRLSYISSIKNYFDRLANVSSPVPLGAKYKAYLQSGKANKNDRYYRQANGLKPINRGAPENKILQTDIFTTALTKARNILNPKKLVIQPLIKSAAITPAVMPKISAPNTRFTKPIRLGNIMSIIKPVAKPIPQVSKVEPVIIEPAVVKALATFQLASASSNVSTFQMASAPPLAIYCFSGRPAVYS